MESIEEVLQQWHPLVYSLSSKNYRALNIPFEDLVQELNITVWKAYKAYDIGRYKTKFSTCLITFLNQRLQNLRNKRYTKKRSCFITCSIECFDLPKIENLFDQLDFSSCFRTKNERIVYNMFLEGYPKTDVKKRIGTEKYKQIDLKLQKNLKDYPLTR